MVSKYEALGISAWELSQEDIDSWPGWFADVYHLNPLWPPLCVSRHPQNNTQGCCYSVQELSWPFCKAMVTRMAHCYYYFALLPVTDGNEIKQREALFREKIRPYIEDFPGMSEKYKAEMTGYYQKLEAVSLPQMSDIDLIRHLYELDSLHRRLWEVHYLLMAATCAPYGWFEELAKELVGIDDTHPTFHKLMSGFDNMTFRLDKMMWGLADRAAELKLTDTFLKLKAEEVAPALQQTEAGRKWLAELNDFLKVHGKRMGQMLNAGSPTWQEDLSFAILRIQGFLKKGGSFTLDGEREKAIRERGEAEKDILAKVPVRQRKWFETLMRCAQNSSSFSEEHSLWCEDYVDFLFHYCALEFGRRFVKAGAIDKVDDIWYISYEDLFKTAHAPEKWNLRPRVNELRALWDGYRKNPAPPVITKLPMEEAFAYFASARDPFLGKIVIGVLPKIKPELKADLYGVPGAFGVAEGTARVILGQEQFGDVQPGDILVCPGTSPAWTCLFPLLKGVVVDRGGSLAHAAVCSREYRIPCILNTMEATTKIKSGQRIKVDANLGAVWILG